MGEEESRAWQRGANSDASIRPFGKCQDFITPHYHSAGQVPLGNAHLPPLEAEAGAAAAGPACLTMTGSD